MRWSVWGTMAALLASAGCSSEGDDEAADATAAGGGAGGAGGAAAPVDAGLPPEAVGLQSIRLLPEAPQIQPGRSRQFQALGDYGGPTEKDITKQVTWSTSDPSLATVENEGRDKGRVHVEKIGRVTITATLGDIQGEVTLGKACQYPEYDLRMALGQAIPPMYWEPAYNGAGEAITYKLEDVACDEEVSVMVFVLGAAWCGACAAYAQRLDGEAAEFEAAGGRIVYVELQNADSEPADSAFANDYLQHLIGGGAGIRVGDLDTRPGELFLTNNAQLDGLPTVYVVRRRDMKVITTADILGDTPLVHVALDPDADWEHPPELPFEGNCGPADEEPGEPNDTPAQAVPIDVGAEIHGGVCDPVGDFYQVQAQGPWQLDLDFQSAVGDLDVYVWDAAADAPLRVNGDIVGSEGTTDHESFTYQGLALVKVLGFRQASATYTLKLQ